MTQKIFTADEIRTLVNEVIDEVLDYIQKTLIKKPADRLKMLNFWIHNVDVRRLVIAKLKQRGLQPSPLVSERGFIVVREGDPSQIEIETQQIPPDLPIILTRRMAI